MAVTSRPTAPATTAFHPGLQGLRGFAASSVLLVHIYLMALHGGFLPASFPEAAFSTLGHGVDLFFMISGFLIPSSLLRHGDLRRFLADRVTRIMPVYVMLHLAVYALGPIIGYKWMRGFGLGDWLLSFTTNLFFLAPLLGLPLAQQNAWTLTWEWLFYIAFGLAWLVVRRHPRLARLAALPVILGVLVVSIRWPSATFFLVGMAFARWQTPASPRGPGGAALVLSMLVAFYGLAQFASPALALLPGAVVFWSVLDRGSSTCRILETRPLQWLGKVSYSLYLVHPVALFPLQVLGGWLTARGHDPHQVFAGFVLVGTPLVLIGSAVSYELLELRLRGSLAYWLQPGRRIVAPAAAHG